MFLLRHTSRDLGIDLFLKDEGQNPTGTFKARGGSVGVARLRELGWRSLAMPTVGSGGSAWAAYAAQLSVRMKVGLPTEPNLPVVGLEEPRLYGAEVDQLPFPRETAFSKMKETLPPDTLYVGGFSEPYRLEGEKTILYEIAEDLGWRLPDFVFWPTGGGVGLVGLAKAASELGELGWVQSSSDMTVVSAQHESGAPIAAALHRGHGGAIPSAGHADGLAPGATHGAPFAGDYILARVRNTVRADGVVGSDDAIRETMKAVAARDGALLCPEGALAVAGAIQMTRGGDIPKGATVVCVNTATGHRYPRVIAQLSSGLIG
jgi:threonine synthase